MAPPTYFADMSVNMKALIERCGMVGRANADLYQRKIGASIVTVRRAGASHVFSSLKYFFLVNQIVVVESIYWNIGRGREIREVAQQNRTGCKVEGSCSKLQGIERSSEHGKADETESRGRV